jgi:hypothetical protein
MPASSGPPVPGTVPPSPPSALFPETAAGSPLPPRPAALGSPPASGASPLCPPCWSTGTPPIIAEMFFPRGAGCLKIPYRVAPRFRSTPFLCRRRATKTLIRYVAKTNELVASLVLLQEWLVICYNEPNSLDPRWFCRKFSLLAISGMIRP